MKLIVIIVALLALVGGGGFAAITFAPSMVPIPIRNLLGVEVTEAEQIEADRPKNTTLIDIEPLTIPMFENGEVDRFLVMHVLLVDRIQHLVPTPDGGDDFVGIGCPVEGLRI
ncbi:hypothetical protein BAL199_25559 [alpha proteobacterium BAL199]|nr:hypothetical protein BAL199_25559 [alpha proteobacterium BAL199]